MNPWTLTYDEFDPAHEGVREALCTLGNGYFATRGAAPEIGASDDVHNPGTYVAGCYNRLSTELAGRTIENEDLVNVPNWLVLRFRPPDGDWFDLRRHEVLDYHQELDIRRGVLTRRFTARDEAGRETSVTQRRLVHMRDPHVAALEVTLIAENWSGPVVIQSALDGRVANTGVARYRQLSNRHLVPVGTTVLEDGALLLEVATSQSRIAIAQAARTDVFGHDGPVERTVVQEPGFIATELRLELTEAEPLRIEKIVSLFTSRDAAISEPGLAAGQKIARKGGFADLLSSHEVAWEHLWNRFRLETGGHSAAEQALNLHIFHLLQTVSKHTIDLDVGVPARGLHGEAYRGHIFWDELFIFPFLNLRMPDLTRALLQYRFRRLPEARWMAKHEGYEGALYPWQSSSDGREESQTLHLNPNSGRWIPDNSRLQRHINIAIAFNVWEYFEATGDRAFLAFYGAEMLLEIARFWASKAEFNPELGRYEIHRVMGPDEYHDGYPGAERPGLDNNAYTNVMAVWVLLRARQALDVIPQYRRSELWEKLGLSDDELRRWEDISRKMRIVFHSDRIISQFEGYDDLEEFDWVSYFERYGDIQRLDRILEAEEDTPNRYKASKQADVLMLFYLLSDGALRELFDRLGYDFDDDLVRRNVDYYMKRTSHGSTLSRVVHSWVLARSDPERSWELFMDALRSDLADIQGGTTAEGIHLGAMAGTVDLVQRGFTGMETREGVLWLDPAVPKELGGLRFDVHYRGQWISLEISREELVVSTHPGPGEVVTVGFGGEAFPMAPGETRRIPLSGPSGG